MKHVISALIIPTLIVLTIALSREAYVISEPGCVVVQVNSWILTLGQSCEKISLE